MTAAEAAAERCERLALRCDPIPERLAEEARPWIDQERLRDPYNAMLTLDGRPVREAWGRWA